MKMKKKIRIETSTANRHKAVMTVTGFIKTIAN